MYPFDQAFIFTSFIIILNQYINSNNLFKVLKKEVVRNFADSSSRITVIVVLI